MNTADAIDPNLDLVFERKTRLPLDELWKGWTDPATLVKWFCPRPWRVTECRIDLGPGGEFYTVMEGPNGERMENAGSYLEVIPNRKLVWTNAFTQGFRPAPTEAIGFRFVAIISFTKTSSGETELKAVIKHGSPEARRQHEQLGFQEGWGKAFEQLASLIRSEPARQLNAS